MNDELNDPEAIRQQMEQTRESLQNKLEVLEQQVMETVQEATGAVAETAEAVKETVETVKETVQGTVESVKDSVQDTVETVKDTVQGTMESVKDTLDLNRHVQEHPWLMCAGAAAIGFVGTRWLTRALASRQEHWPPTFAAPPSMAAKPNGSYAPTFSTPPPAPAPQERSWWSSIAEHYSDELAKIKGLVIGTVGGVVREMVTSNVAPALAEQIKDVVNSVTVKLGGQIVEGPILTWPEETRSTDQPRSAIERDDANGKTVVHSRW